MAFKGIYFTWWVDIGKSRFVEHHEFPVRFRGVERNGRGGTMGFEGERDDDWRDSKSILSKNEFFDCVLLGVLILLILIYFIKLSRTELVFLF
jgi:hypothetical protein